MSTRTPKNNRNKPSRRTPNNPSSSKPRKKHRGKKPGGRGGHDARTNRPEQIDRPGLYRAPDVRAEQPDVAEPATPMHQTARHKPAALETAQHARAETGPATAETAFTSLGLAPRILRAVQEEGYDTPTPIQAQAIPPVLDGRDVLGCAQTGTGKTAAFALPILHKLHAAGVDGDRGYRYPRALILCPTRELAGQITDSFATYGRHTRLRHTAIFGGVSQHRQEKALARGVDILVATPGRLQDLINQDIVDLCDIDTFVLDEADRMLDMGFIQPIRQIAALLPADRQTLLFSATMPKEIRSLADSLLTHPVCVTVSPVASAAPLIEQSVYMVGRQQKQALLQHLLGELGIERTLVFTRTKHGADRVARRLGREGIAAQAIHGNKTQNQRQRALDSFRSGKSRVLVATDVAARGLDIDAVTHVFNFDLPHEPEAYVHRIGRTGRAGAVGTAIAFCDPEERPLLRQIERLTDKPITATSDLPDLPKPTRDPRPERAMPQPRDGAETDRPAHAKQRGSKNRRKPTRGPKPTGAKRARRGRSQPRGGR